MSKGTKIEWTDETWNPVIGCSKVSDGCKNCLGADTPVLMADMSWRPIGEVVVGDRLVGFTEAPTTGRNRIYELSTVVEAWRTKAPAVEITVGKRVIVASEDHRFLSPTRPSWREASTLHLESLVVDSGYTEGPDVNSVGYLVGYVAGAFGGDGTFRLAGSGRRGTKQSYGRVAMPEMDTAALERLADGLRAIGCDDIKIMPFDGGKGGFDPPNGRMTMLKVETRKKRNLERIEATFKPRVFDKAWCAGFLAGFFDTDGSYSRNLRFHQTKKNELLATTQACIRELGFSSKLENYTKVRGKSVRLVGDLATKQNFLSAIAPALERKCGDLFGRRFPKKSTHVDGIKRIGVRNLVDVETTSGTFIAAGLATHNCYAEVQARRIVAMQRGLGRSDSPYEQVVKMDDAGEPVAKWNGKAAFLPERLDQPLRWRRPRRVFVNSMSDLFHEDITFEQIASVFGVMAAAPTHTFQVLTKRPERALAFFEWLEDQAGELEVAVGIEAPAGPQSAACCLFANQFLGEARCKDGLSRAWPLSNIWLGVSVEDQATAEERIPLLLQCPAAIRWVSYEPALGPVDFGLLGTAPKEIARRPTPVGDLLDWIVVGGESGPGARPFDLAWAHSAVTQCQEAGVTVFVKQLGADPRASEDELLAWHGVYPWRGLDPVAQRKREPLHLNSRKGADMDEWPNALRVRQFPEVAKP